MYVPFFLALNSFSKVKIKKYIFGVRFAFLKRNMYKAPLKKLSEKKQLCTASAASNPFVVRKHAFDSFSCIYCTYLLFLTQNGFLEMPY